MDPILRSGTEHCLATLLAAPSSASHQPPLRVAQLEACFAGKACEALQRTGGEGHFDLKRFHSLIAAFRAAVSDACYGAATGHNGHRLSEEIRGEEATTTKQSDLPPRLGQHRKGKFFQRRNMMD